MKTLEQIQREIGDWAREQFGDNVSKDPASPTYGARLGSLPSLLGMIEELGELVHVTVYRLQGRGFDNLAEARDAKEDAIADTLVFMCDYACREGIDLNAVLDKTWKKVQNRRQASWMADKAKEGPTLQPGERPPSPLTIEQDGHGFGHVAYPGSDMEDL